MIEKEEEVLKAVDYKRILFDKIEYVDIEQKSSIDWILHVKCEVYSEVFYHLVNHNTNANLNYTDIENYAENDIKPDPLNPQKQQYGKLYTNTSNWQSIFLKVQADINYRVTVWCKPYPNTGEPVPSE